MIKALRHKIDCFLYKQQFYSPAVRQLLFYQLCIVSVTILIALPTFTITLWPLAFACGAFLALFNLWHIAKFASNHVQKPFSAGMAGKFFLLFNLRLMVTGLALAGLIVYYTVPVVPLIAGLSSVLCVVLFWTLFKATPKHAREV